MLIGIDLGLTGNYLLGGTAGAASSDGLAWANLSAGNALHAWDFLTNQARFSNIVKGALSNTPGWSYTRADAQAAYAQTSAGVLTPFASGELRRTDKGVLIEGARTNLCLQSQTFDNASWTKNCSSISADAVTAPDGTTTADKLVEDSTAANSHTMTQSAGTVTATEVLSIYAKAAERSWLALQLGANRFAYFNLSAGTIGTTSGSTTATITALANGWYRCAIAGVRDTNQNNLILLASADNTSSYNGDGTSGIYLWGAQLEQASFPSSLVTTTTASATRAADVLTVPVSGIDYPISLFAEFERVVDTGGSESLFHIDNGANNDEMHLFVASNDRPNLVVKFGGATQANINPTGAIALATVTKFAARTQTNSAQLARGGSLGTEATTVTVPAAPTRVNFNRTDIPSFGYLRRCALWTRALTDSELQSVTT